MTLLRAKSRVCSAARVLSRAGGAHQGVPDTRGLITFGGNYRFGAKRSGLSLCYAQGHFFLMGFLAGFVARTAARRFSVRFFAAASEAFLARAERSSGVMFLAAVLPPNAPVLRAISRIAARTSAGILTLIPLMVASYGVWIEAMQVYLRFHLTP